MNQINMSEEDKKSAVGSVVVSSTSSIPPLPSPSSPLSLQSSTVASATTATSIISNNINLTSASASTTVTTAKRRRLLDEDNINNNNTTILKQNGGDDYGGREGLSPREMSLLSAKRKAVSSSSTLSNDIGTTSTSTTLLQPQPTSAIEIMLPSEVRVKIYDFLSFTDILNLSIVSLTFWKLLPLVESIYTLKESELHVAPLYRFQNVKYVHICCLLRCNTDDNCNTQTLDRNVACRVVPFLENFPLLEKVWLQGTCRHNDLSQGLAIYYCPQSTPGYEDDMNSLLRSFLGSYQVGKLSQSIIKLYGLRCPRVNDEYVNGNYPSNWTFGGCWICNTLLKVLPLATSYTTPSAYNGWQWDVGYCPDYMPCLTEVEVAKLQSSRIKLLNEEDDEDEDDEENSKKKKPKTAKSTTDTTTTTTVKDDKEQEAWKDWVLELLECSTVCRCHGPSTKFVSYNKEVLDAMEYIVKNHLDSNRRLIIDKEDVFGRILCGYTDGEGDDNMPPRSQRLLDIDCYRRIQSIGIPLDKKQYETLSVDEYKSRFDNDDDDHHHHHE